MAHCAERALQKRREERRGRTEMEQVTNVCWEDECVRISVSGSEFLVGRRYLRLGRTTLTQGNRPRGTRTSQAKPDEGGERERKGEKENEEHTKRERKKDERTAEEHHV